MDMQWMIHQNDCVGGFETRHNCLMCSPAINNPALMGQNGIVAAFNLFGRGWNPAGFPLNAVYGKQFEAQRLTEFAAERGLATSSITNNCYACHLSSLMRDSAKFAFHYNAIG